MLRKPVGTQPGHSRAPVVKDTADCRIASVQVRDADVLAVNNRLSVFQTMI